MFRWLQTPQKTTTKAPPTPKMVQAKIPSSQKVELTKTPNEKLIEFLEKQELKAQADNLKKDATSLNLWNNNIGDAGTTELARVLKDNSTLTSLDLLSDHIGETIFKTIEEYLERNQAIAEKKAESLNAAGDDLYNQEKYSEAIEKYKSAIKIKKGLDQFYNKENLYEKNKKNAEKKYEEQQKQILSENNELAETVNKFFHNPISVSLCYQIITDDFAKLVADKLKVIKTINAIDFMGSTISDQGIKIITEALKTTTQIKKLDFSGCDLGNQKISVLAGILQITTLTHLCLNANYIGTV